MTHPDEDYKVVLVMADVGRWAEANPDLMAGLVDGTMVVVPVELLARVEALLLDIHDDLEVDAVCRQLSDYVPATATTATEKGGG